MSKTVMLDYASNQFEVTYEGYEKIKEIIRQCQICPGCYNRTDNAEHLLVGKKCLACVLDAYPSLTFIGFQRFNTEGYAVYSFVSPTEVTFISTENGSAIPQEDVVGSIEDKAFTIPTIYKSFKSTDEVPLSRSNWSFYGSLDQLVIILHYADARYGRRGLYLDYLAYKGGETVRITTKHKSLLEKARALAERTKKNGYYHLNGQRLRTIDEADLLPIVAQMESASYSEQLRFLNLNDVEEEPDPQIQLLDPDELQPVQDTVQDAVQEEHMQQASTIETTDSQQENADGTDPQQEPSSTEEKPNRRKLRVVKSKETNGETTI